MIPATSETPDYGYMRGTRSGQNRLKQTQIGEIQDRKETKIRVKTPKRKSLKWSGNKNELPGSPHKHWAFDFQIPYLIVDN